MFLCIAILCKIHFFCNLFLYLHNMLCTWLHDKWRKLWINLKKKYNYVKENSRQEHFGMIHAFVRESIITLHSLIHLFQRKNTCMQQKRDGDGVDAFSIDLSCFQWSKLSGSKNQIFICKLALKMNHHNNNPLISWTYSLDKVAPIIISCLFIYIASN